MKKTNLFLLFLLLSVNITYLHAQGKILGQIIDENNNFIEFANFRLFNNDDSTVVSGAYSNEQGRIELNDIPFGKYYSITSFFGYDEKIIENIVVSREKQRVNLGRIIIETIKSQEFEEIVIQGKERSIMESGIDKRVYNVEEDMTTMGGDATDILNNIPSVEVDNDGNISLRGNSGVKILIDGRESAMTSGDDPLAGIPASAIERIEVVTNPSAKYNPEGTAGIINIILKKTKIRGFNGNVSLTAATGHLYNGSVGFNYRNEKVNVFGNYAFRYEENLRRNFSKRKTFIDDDVLFLDQNKQGDNLRRSHTANIGADFFLKENQVFGISLSGRHMTRMGWGDHDNELYFNDNLIEYWERDAYDPRHRKSIDLNANYKYDFKDELGGNLMISATGSTGEVITIGEFEEFYFDGQGNPLSNSYRSQSQHRNGRNQRYSFNADLDRKINNKMKYEAGLEVRIRRMRDDNIAEIYDTISGEFIDDVNLTNKLNHDEDFYSAYGIFAHEVTDLFKYQIGVRLEQALVNPQFLTTNESFKFNYFTPFPSLHLAFGDDDMGTIFLSYSRRINRPRPWQMNPFPTVDDPQNIRKGNPGLKPEFINSVELGYEKVWKKGSISASAYFKHTEHKIQRLTLFLDNGVSVASFENIDQAFDYGLEVIGTFNPFPWWRNMISFNTYESRVSTVYNGASLSNKGFTWDAKINMTFSLFKGRTNIQFNGGYNAPRYTVQGTFSWNPGFDFGVTQSFLDKNLILGVRISDIFDQRGFFMELNDQNREQKTQFKWTSRRVHFTVSYKFGNLKLKEEQKRKGQGDGGDMEMM